MRKSFVIGIILLVAAVGLLFYYGSRLDKSKEDNKPGENNKPEILYSSIDIYDKGRKTFLGNIRIENEKIVSNVTDKGISDFINANKTLWEESQLEHLIGGKTETGALWDGLAETTISDKNHIISIYEILYGKFRDDYNVSLVKEESDN